MKRTAGKSLRTRKAMEQAIHLIFLLCGIVAVGFVLCISVYLVISGLPAIREIGLTKFLFGKVWAPTNATTGPQFGILPFILTSVYGTAGALLLGVPVGLMTAIFLAKAAPPRLAAVIRTAVQLLAGIPSVVYGLVGMIVLVPAIRRAFGLGSGACLLAAILVPNLIFALTHRQGFENAVSCPRLERWEQVGRFGSLAFLVLRLPFLPWGEWFPGGEALSLPISAVLAALYCLGWVLFWREDSLRKSLALSILPSLLFLERGILTGN